MGTTPAAAAADELPLALPLALPTLPAPTPFAPLTAPAAAAAAAAAATDDDDADSALLLPLLTPPLLPAPLLLTPTPTPLFWLLLLFALFAKPPTPSADGLLRLLPLTADTAALLTPAPLIEEATDAADTELTPAAAAAAITDATWLLTTPLPVLLLGLVLLLIMLLFELLGALLETALHRLCV